MKMVTKLPSEDFTYAILSHRWVDDEITYQQFQEGGRYHHLSGYEKVKRAAIITRDVYKLKYVWVDTCCINKMDSSELSESINSMYQWYRDATVCIAFLSDVDSVPKNTDSKIKMTTYIDSMEKSKWFERGWTLQELVAPRKLVFYDKEWTRIGEKTDFVDPIFRITNVPARIIACHAQPSDYSLARRMSWAANRKTTRVEDIAYCMLGIFEVSMPPIYGEGMHAFRRLQEEIVKRSSDLTIFAWRLPGEIPPHVQINGASATQSVFDNNTTVQRERSPATYGGSRNRTPRQVSPSDETLRGRQTLGRQHQLLPSGAASPRSSTEAALSLPPEAPPLARSASSSDVGLPVPKRCLFAESPKLFAGNESLHPFIDDFENFTVTNRGLFISGSIYLRLLYNSTTDQLTSTTKYLFLIGSQAQSFVGIQLLKIGPNLFQRNWDANVAVLKRNDVDKMRGFLVTDWYILIDNPPANTITSKTFRQYSIHVPTKGENNESFLLKDTSPTHLWDVHDRLFLRPKSYGWTRYEMVLAMKCSVSLQGAHVPGARNGERCEPVRVNLIVLCDYRTQQDTVKFLVYQESDYVKQTDMLMVRRAPNSSLMWADLEIMCPELMKLHDHITVNAGTPERQRLFRISVSARAGEVQLSDSNPDTKQDLHSVFFRIERMRTGR